MLVAAVALCDVGAVKYILSTLMKEVPGAGEPVRISTEQS
jgi:hypothetical protein